MQDIMSSIAPMGFERFSPLVNPVEVAVMPPFGPIRAEMGIGPTSAVTPLKPESKGAGAWHSQPRHPARAHVERKAATEVHSMPNGMALLSPAMGRILLEAQASGAL